LSSPYRLAQELDKLRGENKGAANYASTVKKVLDNPEMSRAKTLEDLIKVLGGELIIRWEKTERGSPQPKRSLNFTK
jgi:hypothetical protein